MDPLIRLFKNNIQALEFLGRAWELLYIEGRSPDIGKRRENFIKLLLKYEFNLDVLSAPDTERDWDFKVKVGGNWYVYSLKTTERPAIIKVAWNGFPSWQRTQTIQFKYPILYVMGNRIENRIGVYVFNPDTIYRVRKYMRDDFWWIPRRGTNPRGFGISIKALRNLIKESLKTGNAVEWSYTPIKDFDSVTELYWKGWYELLKRLSNI